MRKIRTYYWKCRHRMGVVTLIAVALVLTAVCWHSIAADAVAVSDVSNDVNAAVSDAAAGPGFFEMKRWSPYVVGLGIGILSWIAFILSDHPIGVSTAYAQTAGMLEKAVFGNRVEETVYYQKYLPRVGWTWMLVVGLFAGALVSAATSGDFALQWVPPLWGDKFGYSPIVRWASAFFGGVILGIGARWSDGCTSGHGISGTLQLIVSSWVAVICFFMGGVLVAHIIY